MIRTVWLAITLLIGLAALTILKVVGIKPFVDQSVPLQETIGTNLQSESQLGSPKRSTPTQLRIGSGNLPRLCPLNVASKHFAHKLFTKPLNGLKTNFPK